MLDRQAIALRFGNLFAVLIEEQLVDQAVGLATAQHSGDLARLYAGIGQVLTIHLIIDIQCDPAHGEIDLPLQLGHTAKSGLIDHAAVFVSEADCPRIGVDNFNGHLQHMSRIWTYRHDGRICRGALCPQCRQHDIKDRLIVAQHILQRVVKCAGIVSIA